MTLLLATKLRCPPAPPRWLRRPRLERRLDEGLAAGRLVTLVSAPAGFGKTTLVSHWLAERMKDEGRGMKPGSDLALQPSSFILHPSSFAWLSLGPADDEPERFFAYLVAALQQLDPRIGRDIQGALRSGQLPAAEAISATLINDSVAALAGGGRALLVLDDLQVIADDFIVESLAQLIANLPPELHLVLLAREDPSLSLARLRANNLLTELRAADLRLSTAESDQFLREVMGLALDAADLAVLDTKTEGWIVGLQLAGLSIRDRADPAAFIAALSGSHRHILAYLTEEVLARQPADVRDFLLQTAILDTLSGELCAAVTGRADSQRLLAQIAGANLFLVPLDDEQRWYRYHHLFADMLRELQRDDTGDLHRRAARWYAQSGMVREAMQHALAAPDYAFAVGLVEAHALDMVMQWYATTVKEWMAALPPEWLARSPRANLAFAWTYLLHGGFDQVPGYLARLQTIFTELAGGQIDAALEAEWLALQATLLNAQGRPEEGLALARQALARSAGQAGYAHSLACLALAGASQQLDDDDGAIAAYRMIVSHGRALGNSVIEMLGLSGLGLLALHRGELREARALAARGIEQLERAGTLLPISTAFYGEIGQVHYQWHEIEPAMRAFRRSVEVSALSGYRDAELYDGVVRSRLALMAGDLPSAAAAVAGAVALMQTSGAVAVRDEVLAQQLRVYLAMDRLAEAELLLDEHQISLPATSDWRVTPTAGLRYACALRLMLYRARVGRGPAELTRAITLADHLLAAALQRHYTPLAIETLLLRAQMRAAQGDRPAALGDYAQALDLGAPEGFVSIFVEEGRPAADALRELLARGLPDGVRPDYVHSILAACAPAASAPAGEPALAEPLSAREIEVVRLMDAGCSNQEIADRLSVTLHTVKKHSSNIFGKLGVASRTQAVAAARRRGLL